MTEIITTGKINKHLFEDEFGTLKTDEIIITNERLEHIKLRHEDDFQFFKQYISETVTDPDIIIKVPKNKNSEKSENRNKVLYKKKNKYDIIVIE